ncbi:MAG: DUF3037 domain-containing protein [Terriglobia bacterium]
MPESPESKNCEYFLAYYAPSALRETRVAIGLFLFEQSGRLVGHRMALVGHRMIEDWRTVRCLDPQADLVMLGSLSAHFERLATENAASVGASEFPPHGEGLYERLRRMEQEFSGSLEISPARGVLTADPQQELDRLFEQHVAPRRPLPSRAPLRIGSRLWIRGQMSDAIRRHGLWERFDRDVSVEQFTAPGDGFRMDFRCQPNGVAQYLHALSLERDWTQAKLLGYTCWRIREKTAARLTAVVADADPALPAVQSCRRILTEAQVAVEPLSRLDALLESVRQEFGSSEPSRPAG